VAVLGKVVVVEATLVRLPTHTEERRGLLVRVGVGAFPCIGLAAGQMPPAARLSAKTMKLPSIHPTFRTSET
jgi:hypothetical protein